VPRLERLIGRLSAAHFPRWAVWILLVLGMLLPGVLAIAVVPKNNPLSHEPGALVAGIVILEFSVALWYVFTRGFFRTRIRWWPTLCAGIAAVITQLVSTALLNVALVGAAVPFPKRDLAQMVLGAILVPVFCGVNGVLAILTKRPAREWLELDIDASKASAPTTSAE
jgi:hypothetical protein